MAETTLTAMAGVPQRKWSRDIQTHSVYEAIGPGSTLLSSGPRILEHFSDLQIKPCPGLSWEHFEDGKTEC